MNDDETAAATSWAALWAWSDPASSELRFRGAEEVAEGRPTSPPKLAILEADYPA